MREFLRQVFLLSGKRERSWHVARLDYTRWHVCLNCAEVSFTDVVLLWETDGRIAAVAMPDGGRGEAHLMVHPMLQSSEMETEMLARAEERLAIVKPDGTHRLCAWAPAADKLRQSVLTERGYVKRNSAEYQWRRQLETPIVDVPLPTGFSIKPVGEGLELLERCWASGLGFHEGDIKVAADNRNDVGWYRNIQTAPLYRRDLDLTVVASDGAIASFCTIWFDDVTRSAYIEPVATIPAFQRRGLGKALLTEGLKRLQPIGASTAFVGGFSPAANGLYQSVMGTDYELYEPWVKEW